MKLTRSDAPKAATVILLGLSLAAAAAWLLHGTTGNALDEFSWPIAEFRTTGHISTTFLPVGYAAWVAIWERLLGESAGARAGNVLLWLLLGAATYLLCRSHQVKAFPSGVIASLCMLHPDVVIASHQISDLTVSCALLLLYLALLRRAEGTLLWSVLAGISLGAANTVRPNFLLLLPLLAIATWHMPLRRRWVQWGAAGLAGVLTYAFLTAILHGSPFWPSNGPYNLYAGNNQGSIAAMRQFHNAEPSIIPLHAPDGRVIPLDYHRLENDSARPDTRDTALQPDYLRWTRAYLASSPSTAARLAGWKAVTLFNPFSPGQSKTQPIALIRFVNLLVLPALCVLLAVWRNAVTPSTRVIWAAVPLLYVAPFLLTNADPRFGRTLLIFCVVAVAILFCRQQSAPSLQ